MRVFELITRGAHWTGAAFIAMVMLLVVANVIGRRFLVPVPASLELTLYMMGICCSLIFAQTQMEGRHISVDLVTSRLKPRAQAILKNIGMFIILIPMAVIIWGVFLTIQDSVVQGGEPSQLLDLPVEAFRGVLLFGMVLVFVTVLLQLTSSVFKRGKQ